MDVLLLRHELAAINPTMLECPPEFHYHSALLRVSDLCAALEDIFKAPFPLDLGIQDATYHASMSIPPVLMGDATIAQSAIRLSNFHQLAVITGEEKLLPEIQQTIEHTLTRMGYRYLPFRLFGTSFETLQRHTGDLFNQLFDYT